MHSKDTERNHASAVAAAGRLFRTYEDHCRLPGVDTLFNTLNSMHSLNDRLRGAVGRDFHEIEEFIALKSLRNFVHHQDEIRDHVSVVPRPAVCDLAFLCIVRSDQVDRAIENVDKRWRSTTRAACKRKFHWYGQAVDINPCLYNFMVLAYELLLKLEVLPPKEDVRSFEESYSFESEHGHSHLIDGRLFSYAGNVDAALSAIVAELPKP